MTFVTVLCGCKAGLGQHDYDLAGDDYTRIKRVRSIQTDFAIELTKVGSNGISSALLRQSDLHQEQYMCSSDSACRHQTSALHLVRYLGSKRWLWLHRHDDGAVAVQATQSDMGAIGGHML